MFCHKSLVITIYNCIGSLTTLVGMNVYYNLEIRHERTVFFCLSNTTVELIDVMYIIYAVQYTVQF